MTGSQLLAEGARTLREAGIDGAPADARRLLAHALGLTPDRLTLALPEAVSDDRAVAYRALLARRATREPVSHLTGTRLFWGREFRVTPAVLDPRPETEILVAAALEEPFAKVLDLGTGSGCILLSLLADRPQATGQGLDLSPAALAVARHNAARLDVAERAALVLSDWLEQARGPFDLIVSNPPYIAAAEMPGLEPEVRDHEPRMALTDGADGLGAYRAILAGARPHLDPNGRLLLEIGPTQAAAIAAIGAAEGWPAPEVRRDFDGRDRVLLFRVA